MTQIFLEGGTTFLAFGEDGVYRDIVIGEDADVPLRESPLGAAFREIVLGFEDVEYVVTVPANDIEGENEGISLLAEVVATRPLRLYDAFSGRKLPGLHKGKGFVLRHNPDNSMLVAFRWGDGYTARATVRAGSLKRC